MNKLSHFLLLMFCLGSHHFLVAQADTIYFFDFEEVDAEVTTQGNINSSIKNNRGEFQDAVPRYPQRTVVYGNSHNYKNAEFGNYPVGRRYLFHSPTWETPDKKGVSFNHIELSLDTALTEGTYYRFSFLIANMKSHRYKPGHYGVKFSKDKIIKESAGSLMSAPDIFFDFTNDDAFVEIQAIMFFEKPVRYIYFGMFSEDSVRVPKKFTHISDKVSYADTAAYYLMMKPTRVCLDNIFIQKLGVHENNFKDIYFKLDDDQITVQKDIAQIIAIAQKMKDLPDMYLLIQGYADASGAFLHNLDLSNRRAASVKALLLEQGIDERRIVTIGKGIFQAKNDDSDPGSARKVSFLLLQS